MVIFLAGLQNIPITYYEAAIVDGVSGWKQFRYITLPLLTPTTIVVSLVTVVNAFQAFTVPFVMTKGGPAERTSILPIQLYKTGFMYFKMGKASAISVIIFVIIAVFAITQFRLSRKFDQ
jgi:ABC-type sugar transport system permease subunit